MKKNEKGITLVALVVTIIVLLILAGVTIAMTVNGNGLFQRARKSTDAYNQAQHEEQQALAGYSDYYDRMKTEYAEGGSEGITPAKESYTIGETVTLGGEKFFVIENSTSSSTTVKLLAAKCIDTGTNKQSDNPNYIEYDIIGKEYANTNIKRMVDAYATSLGTTISEARLMSKNEADVLISANTDILYGTDIKLKYPLNTRGFYMGNDFVWAVDGEKSKISRTSSYMIGLTGPEDGFLRPLLIVAKSGS